MGEDLDGGETRVLRPSSPSPNPLPPGERAFWSGLLNKRGFHTLFSIRVLTGVSLLSLLGWIYLIAFHGRFWRSEVIFHAGENMGSLDSYPQVVALIPARNESKTVQKTVCSVFNQSYPGLVQVILVDDRSSDDTVQKALQAARSRGKEDSLKIIRGSRLPEGWTGKVWALQQGFDEIQKNMQAKYIWLTDADISYSPETLAGMVGKMEKENHVLLSLMARLQSRSYWEKFLVPTFVYFFQLLYPFSKVNDPHDSTAGAAGGCMLIQSNTLERIGGFESISRCVIDDCELAKRLKKHGSIWLGLTKDVRSHRTYQQLRDLWETVARTAFTQLNYSGSLLMLTVFGLGLMFFVPPIGLVLGLAVKLPFLAFTGLFTWIIMSVSYVPILRFYDLSPGRILTLPLSAGLYLLMTLDSARRYWLGKGRRWKQRTY